MLSRSCRTIAVGMSPASGQELTRKSWLRSWVAIAFKSSGLIEFLIHIRKSSSRALALFGQGV
ncbi:hypothetical protein EMIT0P258_120221 [Pseudomonas sp. IT-P258]